MLHFKEYGKGNKEAIVFIHGLGGNLRQMERQIPLSDDFYLVFVDLQGFGKSDVLSSLSFSDQAMEVFRVMDFLKIERFHVLGVSMGGVIAQEMTKIYPDRIKSIILSNTFAKIAQHIRPLFEIRTIQNALENNMKHTVENFLYDKENKENILAIKRGNTINKESYITSARQCLEVDNREFLKTLNIPALIITGQHDFAMPMVHSIELHRLIKYSEFIAIPKSAHLPNIEQPEEFNNILRTFLKQKSEIK